MELHDPNRSYDYLFRAVEKQLKNGRRERMRNAMSRGLLDASGGVLPTKPVNTPAVPGTPSGEQSPRKGKGKGKDGKRANSEPASKKVDGAGKARECFFHKKGTCRNGATCPFLHTDGGAASAKAAAKKKTEKADSKKEFCPYFAKGSCRYGDACTKSHGTGSPRATSPKAKGRAAKAKAKGKKDGTGAVARPSAQQRTLPSPEGEAMPKAVASSPSRGREGGDGKSAVTTGKVGSRCGCNAFTYSTSKTGGAGRKTKTCLLYTSPSPRDQRGSRMPSSA